MSKKVAKKQSNLPAEMMDPNAWGDPGISSEDVVIPKIIPMQAMSPQVMDGEAKFGELRESLENRLMGGPNSPLEVIPFHLKKQWLVFSTSGNKREFIEAFPVRADNENLSWEDVDENGDPIRRIKSFDFYVLLPEEVKSGDALPYVISFRSSSMRAGRTLATIMYMKNKRAKLPPPGVVVEIAPRTEKNDLGTFIVLDVHTKRKSENDEIAEAFNWYKMVLEGKAKEDEADHQAHDVVDNTPKGKKEIYEDSSQGLF